MNYLKQLEYFMHGASTVLAFWALSEICKYGLAFFSLSVGVILFLCTLWFIAHLFITLLDAFIDFHNFISKIYNGGK